MEKYSVLTLAFFPGCGNVDLLAAVNVAAGLVSQLVEFKPVDSQLIWEGVKLIVAKLIFL